MTEALCAVIVTHRRPELLAKSLAAVCTQTRLPDHVIVVDNDNDPAVRVLVESQPVATTYLGSARNLGGAGGFALGILHALALGADWVWLADDDGRPADSSVLATLLDCAAKHDLAEVSPMVCDLNEPERLAFPLRRGLVWRRRVSELQVDKQAGVDLLPGIASLFHDGTHHRMFSAHLEAIGKPVANVRVCNVVIRTFVLFPITCLWTLTRRRDVGVVDGLVHRATQHFPSRR